MPTPDSTAVLARVSAPAVPDPVSFAVVADPHVSPRAEGTAMVYHRSEARLRAALTDATRRGVDAVVSAGDLTKDGAHWEYDLLDEVLGDFDVPFLAVPGNHDVPKAPVETYEYGDDHDSPPVDRFADAYAPDGSYPFHERIGDVDLVGIDTASGVDGSLAETHDGAVSRATVDWLDDTLGTLETPVVVMHHNTPAMFDQLRAHRDAIDADLGLPPVLRDPEPLIETLTDHDVPLAFTGHLHNVGVARTGPLREVTAPATGSFPQAYLHVAVGPDGTVVRYVPVTDATGMAEAHRARVSAGETAASYASFAATRLACLPLVDEVGGSDPS
jgi:3',5'-cyclic AMP phosphodiesterase CpdA